jgi:hypothetical protein
MEHEWKQILGTAQSHINIDGTDGNGTDGTGVLSV